VGHAAVVSGLTLVSRITGLVRDAVLAAVFGASLFLDAFLVGFIVPNLFRRLFGEGALTAAFIPRYTKLLKDDPALAGRFASLCIVVVAMLLAGITLVGEGVLAVALSWTSDLKASLPLRLTMLMLPYMPMVCGVAFLGAVLQVHRRFGRPAAAPILLNLVMIAAAAGSVFALADDLASIRLVAWSVLLAGVWQLLWLGLSVRRHVRLGLDFAGTGPTFRRMLVTMGPMVIGLGVFQINTLLDGLIAYTLAAPQTDLAVAPTFTLFGREYGYPMDTGAMTTLTLAQRLYQFPLGVFGIAIATAIFPALAHAAAERKAATPSRDAKPQPAADDDFAAILRRGLRLTFFIGLPASVGLILVRVPLTRVFFEWRDFTGDDALRSAAVLAGYGSAVWAYSLTHVLTRAYYAVDDATTPLRVSLGMVGFNLALNLTLIWPLGVAGLAWSTALSATLQVGLLLALVRRHVARPITPPVLGSLVRTAGLTMLMAAAVAAVLSPFDVAGLDKAGCLGVLALAIAVGVVVVVGGAVGLRSPEVDWLRRRRVPAAEATDPPGSVGS
jgi:putative peptidoglycan lipid II flippase